VKTIFLGIGLLAPFWEYVIFIGIFPEMMLYNSTLGMVVTSVVFAMLHGYFSPEFIFFFLMGIC
jgi:uncharacterized protein